MTELHEGVKLLIRDCLRTEGHHMGLIRIKRFGWRIEINYGAGERFRKAFSDSAYGGQEEAKRAALQLLNEQLARKPYPLLPFFRNPCASNTSGTNGVSITRNGDRKCINVSWMKTPDKRSQKRFYYDQFDSDEACLAEAIKYRHEMEREIIRYRKAHQLRPFDGLARFCQSTYCPNRVPVGFSICSTCADYNAAAAGYKNLIDQLQSVKKLMSKWEGV